MRLAQQHESISEIPAATQMKRRIFGLENEYGLTCTLNGQPRLSPDNVARYLFEKVIPGARHANVFLENGARLYLDTGFHPEYATPECDDVAELVIHDKAGERIVDDLRHQAEKRLREDGIEGNILLFKNNTDSAGNSYGCHENYLVSRDVSFQRLAEVLIPFFVTRQIFAGAGKVLQTPRGFHYCLSQRAQHICQEISGATTSSRSIINTRDEPHAEAERYRRLHIIVGDSNMSEVATYLKLGTTALVLDMIEDGFFDRDYSLQSPVQAIRDISHDPTLREAITLKDGRTITALQIQLEYLECATRYGDSISPDPATKDVLARWADVLTKLESDPMQLSRELDWVIKKAWIDKFMDRDWLSWRNPKVSLLDLQYHDIRPEKGVYHRLALNDQVDRITDDETIEQAKHVPPQTTRARLRGEFIRQANLKGKDYRVDWAYLKLNDPERETILCKDPFQFHDERIERLIRSF
jgi:proteasome accessory factor A